uniref:Uncharacterized protein n=1 Tax=mine drainage metagenome TaxID=410659 RepID=E6QPB3_9ZZZZ
MSTSVRFSPRRRQFDLTVRTLNVKVTDPEKELVDAAVRAGGHATLRSWIVSVAKGYESGPMLREISRLSAALGEVSGAFRDLRAELEEVTDELRRRPDGADASFRAAAAMERVEGALGRHELGLGDVRQRLSRVAIALAERI